jgi:hypothetical protein
MGLPEDVSKLLKSEGYKINETIQDAINDFLEVVTSENEEMEDDLDDDKDDDLDEMDEAKVER